MDFGKALELIKLRKRVARTGWNGKDMWVALKEPDISTDMTLPYVFMRTAQGDYVPWSASQSDILAEDWILFAEFKAGG